MSEDAAGGDSPPSYLVEIRKLLATRSNTTGAHGRAEATASLAEGHPR